MFVTISLMEARAEGSKQWGQYDLHSWASKRSSPCPASSALSFTGPGVRQPASPSLLQSLGVSALFPLNHRAFGAESVAPELCKLPVKAKHKKKAR